MSGPKLTRGRSGSYVLDETGGRVASARAVELDELWHLLVASGMSEEQADMAILTEESDEVLGV